MRDFSRAAKTYDHYALLQRNVTDKLFEICKPSSGVVLDIGCGTGYFHELLRKNKIYLPLVQADISQEMCKVAASYASSIEYGGTYTCALDMHNLPFADNSFSSIFSSMTMQWSQVLKQVISEAKRVLINKGNFSFSIVADGSLHELREAFLLAGLNPPIHDFISHAQIETTLRQIGFSTYEIYNETITMFYEDIYSLLRAIKNIGASYKGTHHNGFRGKGHFVEVARIYQDKFFSSKGLPASWNITYVKVSK